MNNRYTFFLALESRCFVNKRLPFGVGSKTNQLRKCFNTYLTYGLLEVCLGVLGVLAKKLPGLAFRGATWTRPPGKRRRQPFGITPFNHMLCKVGIFIGQPRQSP